MKRIILLILLTFSGIFVFAQPKFTYKIKADSVLITNDSCEAELILENHTRNVLGFLYNPGNGRTEFKRGLISSGDSMYIIGADTLKLHNNPYLASLFHRQGGNSYGAPLTLGTNDNEDVKFFRQGNSFLEFRRHQGTTGHQALYLPLSANTLFNAPVSVPDGISIFSGLYNGFPTLDMVFPYDTAALRIVSNLNLFGQKDHIVQLTPRLNSRPGAFGIFEAYGYDGIRIGSANGGNTIYFDIGRVNKARINSTGELMINSSTDQGDYTFQNTGGSYFNATGKTFNITGLSRNITSALRDIKIDTVTGNVYYADPGLSSENGWALAGNTGIDSANHFLGTTDSTRLAIRTNNQQRLSVFADGTFNIAATDTISKPLFRVYPNGNFSFSAENKFAGNVFGPNGGVRFNSKYNILEVGTGNNFDTTEAISCCGSHVKSALVINSDFINTFKGGIHGSLISGDNMTIDSSGAIAWSSLIGESHYINGGISRSSLAGWGFNVNNGGNIQNSMISGISNGFHKPVRYLIVGGSSNAAQDTTSDSFISGRLNSYGGMGQFVAGGFLVNRTPYGATVGNGNVDFSSLPYTGFRGVHELVNIANIGKYPVFALGNSKYAHDAAHRSNAMTILYNGRTQINTTGFDNNLAEADVTPKAALEIVSTNSGILIPKLTTTQRNAIAGGDLHNGLLLYNTDSSRFQFYNGSVWKELTDLSASSAEANIYNADGTVTSAVRTIDLNSNRLAFNNGNVTVTSGKLGVGTTSPAYPIETPDSLKVGDITISKRGYGGAASINTSSFITFMNNSATMINQSPNSYTPQFRLTGPDASTVLNYSGAINGFNYASPMGVSQPLLITTSAFAIPTYPYAGNIILRPGTNAGTAPTTDYVTQYTHDSVLVQLNGKGIFSVNKKTYLSDTLQTPNIPAVSPDTTAYKPVVTDANGNHYKTNWSFGGSGSSVNYSVQSLTESGSTITWNVTNGINGVVTLTGTGRTLSISNPVAGHTYTIRILQDGIGNRTVTTWPTNSKWPGGNAPVLSTGANMYDIVVFYYDGTNFYGTYQPNFQ